MAETLVVEKKAITGASSSAVTSLEAAAAAQEQPTEPSTRNRCRTCSKKVGLTGFQCRCGGTFCSMHRYMDSHQCSFDYKTADREKIAKQNPVVMADKINKI